MAERKTTYRVDSPKIQGEGSWVELSYITRAEAKAEGRGDDWADELIAAHVVAWDWVDAEGDLLPVEETEKLFQHEREFIIGKLFNPDQESVKN